MLGGVVMALVVAMTFASAPRAMGREVPLRVVIVVSSDEERQLAARVEGQTTELEVAITVEEVGPGLESEQLAAVARALVAEGDAEVAIWFVAQADGWVVSVSRGSRTYRRLVKESRGAMSSSASIEAVAVAVRTTLRGVVAGEEVVESPPAEPAASPVRLLAEVGWTVVVDRPAGAGHHGVEARVGAGVGAWRFALLLALHPLETIEVTDATLLLERQVGALVVGYDFLLGPRWRLGGAVAVELLGFPRTTTSPAGGLIATTPQTSLSAAVRPELEVALRLVWSLWASLRVGGDFLFRRPVFAVSEPGGVTRTIAELWSAQPSATLALGVEWP